MKQLKMTVNVPESSSGEAPGLRLTTESNCDQARAELLGEKRHKVLDLAEIEHYGHAMFGDRQYIQLYGMKPREFLAKGVRISGRTAAECQKDSQAKDLGLALRETYQQHFSQGPAPVLVDLFAGSGNTLFQVAQVLPCHRVVGSENDRVVYELTRRNFSKIGFSAEIILRDCQRLQWDQWLQPERPCVAIFSPPWGDGYAIERGLDLRRTTPPVKSMMDLLYRSYPEHRWIFTILMSQCTDESSIEEILEDYPLLRRELRYLICAPGGSGE